MSGEVAPADVSVTPAPAEAPASVETPAPAAGLTPPQAEANLLGDVAKTEPAAEPEKTGEPEKPAEEQPAERTVAEILEGITLPENVAKDDALLNAFLEGAAKGGMDNESVQAVLDSLAPKIQEQLLAPYEAWKNLQEQWQGEIKADPEIGGDKLPDVLATVNKAFGRYAKTAEERQALTNALVTTGAGNNPAIVRMFHRMARDLTEGGPVTGSPATSGKDPAALLYPKTGAQE